MGSMQHREMDVSGTLDTAMPDTNRPIGTLLEATELSPLWWGPRNGFTQQTWAYQSATYPDPGFVACDGNNVHGVMTSYSPRQMNLPTAWTLDIVHRPTGVSHSADTNLKIFDWELGGVTAISVNLLGPGAGVLERKLRATIIGTTSPGVAGTSVTLTSSTVFTVGSTVAKTQHIRIVRDGASLSMKVNGVSEATSSAFSATERHEMASAATTAGHAYICGTNVGGNHLYAGNLYSILLRAGAQTDVTKGLRPFAFSRSPSVHFAYAGFNTADCTVMNDLSLHTGQIVWTSVATATSGEPAAWLQAPVQGGSWFRDYRGRLWNVVVAGGNVYWRRVA